MSVQDPYRITSVEELRAAYEDPPPLIVPKLDVFLRLNGAATVTRDPALCELLKEGTKLPKTVVKLAVKEAYFHCGKAFRRSHLWAPENWPDVSGYPTMGKVRRDLAQISELTAEQLDQLYDHALREELYRSLAEGNSKVAVSGNRL